ncbi:hypothetical protein [Streptomyces sp. CA-106110]|uniref:hypothetical protein n=1 Tax=Streptomyces sp. CA-106110 TaxID=3240044 RepID=UPI003D8FAFD2
MPGGGLGVTQPQFPEVSATDSERVVIQCAADHFGHGVALLLVELLQKAEHAAGDAPFVSVDHAIEEGTARVSRNNVPGGFTSHIPQRIPELTPFGSAWQRERGEEVDQMAVGRLVV